MAMKKSAGSVYAANDGPKFEAAPGKRPTVAIGPLSVEAQGAIFKGDDRVIVVVRVRDQDGAPVAGLDREHFKWWRLGHSISEFSAFWVVELENIPGLEGMYQLVQDQWSTVGNGTIPLYVHVATSKQRSGGALTFLVKVREGLDA